MDKYEYHLKVDQIEKLMKKKDYQTAVQIADTIDWRRAKDLRVLYSISEVYEKMERYEDCMEILSIAYDRAPVGRLVLYKMTEIATLMGDLEEAISLYRDFIKVAPHDQSRFILKYQIYRKRGSSLEEQIIILKEYKSHEYQEKWAYELASLYAQAGMERECVQECDELILWFSEGEYVTKALKLKQQYEPLTASQQMKYQQVQQASFSDEISFEQAEVLGYEEDKFSTVNLQAELAANVGEVLLEDASIEIPELDPAKKPGEMTSEIELPELVLPGEAEEHEIEELEFELEELPLVEEEIPEAEEEIELEDFSLPGEEVIEEESELVLEEFPLEEEEIVLEAAQDTKEEPEFVLEEVSLEEESEPLLEEEPGLALEELPLEEEEIVLEAEVAPEPEEEPEIVLEEVFLEEESEPVLEEEPELVLEELPLGEEKIVLEAAQDAKKEPEFVLEEISFEETSEPQLEEELEPQLEEESELVLEEFPLEEEEIVLEVVQEPEEEPEVVLEEVSLEKASEPLLEEYPVFTQEIHSKFEDPENVIGDIEHPSAELYGSGEKDTSQGVEKINEILADWEDKVAKAEAIIEATAEQEQERKEKVKQETVELMKLISGVSNEIPKDVQQILEEIDEEKKSREESQAVKSESESKSEEPEKEEELSIEELTPGPSLLKREKLSKDTASMNMIQELERALSSEVSQMAVDAGHLTVEQVRLFDYFTSVRGMSEQLSLLFKGKSRKGMTTSSTGNLVVSGKPGNGKTTLAIDIVKALQKQNWIEGSKLAKITGKKLNTKDIYEVFASLKSGALIIERAGEISEATMMALSLTMETDTGGLLVILEDTSEEIAKLFHKNKNFASKFEYTIDIPVFTNDELVAFGKSYALEQEYTFDEFALLALYGEIGSRQTNDHMVTVAEVKEIIDAAIAHAGKGGIRHLIERVTKKSQDEYGNKLLREADFAE